MIRRIGATTLALVLTAAAAGAVSLIRPVERPVAPTVELPHSTQLTCVPAGEALIATDGAVTVTALGGEAGDPSPELRQAATEGAAVVRSDSLAVAGVLTSAPQAGYAPCATPSTSGMLMIADPSVAELVLVNSDSSEAAVDLTLLGTSGELEPVGARGIAIAPGVERRIALSVLAPEGPVGVEFTATQGRVAVMAVGVEGRAAAPVASSPVSTEHVIAGIPADAVGPRLLLSNPSENRLDVRVEALGSTSSYEPATATGLSLPPMSSLSVELGDALGGEASSLRVTSDEPIGAAVALLAGDVPTATLTAGQEGTDLGAFAPAGVLQLTNPGSEVATVRLVGPPSAEDVSVGPGTTVAVPLEGTDAQQVRVSSSQEIVAAVVSPAAAGPMIVPLGPLSGPEPDPGTITLDPTLR